MNTHPPARAVNVSFNNLISALDHLSKKLSVAQIKHRVDTLQTANRKQFAEARTTGCS